MFQNSYSDQPSKLEKFALLVALLAIFGEACCSYFLGNQFRYVVVAAIMFSLLATFLKWLNGRMQDMQTAPLAATALCLCFFSYPFWTSSYNIYAYAGIPIAFCLFHLDRQLLNKILITLLIINLGLALYEFLTKSYLFSNEFIKNGEVVIYDMKAAGGWDEVIRVKGLFYGCLSLGLFALGIAFFFSKNALVMILCLIVAVLSGTRLAILMILALIFINPAIKMKYRIFFLIAMAFLIIGGITLLSQYDYATMERIIRVFDMEEGSHDNRILMWQCGLEQFLSYDFMHTLAGDNGLFYDIYTNNTESGWITLLTDTGIAGFLLYLVPLVYLLCRFLIEKKYHLAAVVIIFFGSNITVTFNLSMTGNLMYWLCMFKFYEELSIPNNCGIGNEQKTEPEKINDNVGENAGVV